MSARCTAAVWLVASFAVVAGAACKPSARAQLIDAPSGDVATLVAAQVTTSGKAGRTALVYVGAPWCEPCERFRAAVGKGALDDVFGSVDFVVFNLDVDRERLDAAGYSSRMIPLVVVPDAQGRATSRRMEGGIKGDGAVAYMKPRVQALLR